MQCGDIDPLLDGLPANEEFAEDIASHVATCRRCGNRRANAETIERLLRDMPPIVVPAGFTNMVVSRMRRDRWRSEQVLDWTFNVAVSFGVLLIVAGLFGLAWVMGFVSVGSSLMTVLSEGTPLLLTRIAQQAQTVALAGVLLTMALGLWWWVEGDMV